MFHTLREPNPQNLACSTCNLTEDSSSTYLRKIDLILRYDDRKNLDLCNNQWKRSRVISALKLKQQSKSLRVNASIMNSLYAFGTSPSSLLEMETIGNGIAINRSGRLLTKSYYIDLHRYIYRLTKVDDYFIATTIQTFQCQDVF